MWDASDQLHHLLPTLMSVEGLARLTRLLGVRSGNRCLSPHLALRVKVNLAGRQSREGRRRTSALIGPIVMSRF